MGKIALATQCVVGGVTVQAPEVWRVSAGSYSPYAVSKSSLNLSPILSLRLECEGVAPNDRLSSSLMASHCLLSDINNLAAPRSGLASLLSALNVECALSLGVTLSVVGVALNIVKKTASQESILTLFMPSKSLAHLSLVMLSDL